MTHSPACLAPKCHSDRTADCYVPRDRVNSKGINLIMDVDSPCGFSVLYVLVCVFVCAHTCVCVCVCIACVCDYACMCVTLRVCAHVCGCVCLCMREYVCICALGVCVTVHVCVTAYVCTFMWVCMCVYAHVHLCAWLCMHVCVTAYVCTFLYARTCTNKKRKKRSPLKYTDMNTQCCAANFTQRNLFSSTVQKIELTNNKTSVFTFC